MQKPVTLITGAAQRIGAAIAEHLAARGHDLVLHYHRSQAGAEQLAARLQRSHGAAVTLRAWDLGDAASLTDFWNGLPPVTALVHNAARFVQDDFTRFTAHDLRQHLALNLEAPLLLSQGFLAQLPQTLSGSIIVLGDGIKGWSIAPQFFTYAVSKLGWEALIDLLAIGLAPRARANLVALGPTLEGPTDDEGLFERLATRAPLARTGSAEEVCHAIDFLLASPGVTGQVISLANGMGLTTKRPL